MNQDDFRCMRRGKQLALLGLKDLELLGGFSHRGGSKDKALLLLHGFSSTPAVYRLLLPYLTQYDTIIAPTLPGHGTQLDDFSQVKASNWLNAVEQECDKLCREYTTIDVLGLSLGGLLACHLSHRFTLNHLYLLAPALDLQFNVSAAITLAFVLQSLGFCRLRANAGDLHTNHSCEIAYRQLPLSTIIEVLRLIKHFQFVLPTCPTDVFLGEYDKVVNSKKVAARFTLSEPEHIKIHWLKNSAHVLPLDGDIEMIVDCMRNSEMSSDPGALAT